MDLQLVINSLPWLASATGIGVVGRKTIARVVAGVTDVAMLGIEARVQQAKDDREGRALVSKALAEAVAARVGGDVDLVERAMLVHLGEATRKQASREAVAKAAVDNLQRLPPPETVANSPRADGLDEVDDVDEDWISNFLGHAERASSERMQQLWGRVLAGEITKRGSFSPATLRVISELSPELAETFDGLARRSLQGVLPKGKEMLVKLSDLEIAGLITWNDGNLQISFKETDTITVLMQGKDYGVTWKGPSVKIAVIRLTPIGRECASLLRDYDEKSAALGIIAEIMKNDLHGEVGLAAREGNRWVTASLE